MLPPSVDGHDDMASVHSSEGAFGVASPWGFIWHTGMVAVLLKGRDLLYKKLRTADQRSLDHPRIFPFLYIPQPELYTPPPSSPSS